MKTFFYTHPDCLRHEMGACHPESPQRLQAIDQAISKQEWHGRLVRQSAPPADTSSLTKVHDESYVNAILAAAPKHGMAALDADTSMNPYSLDAALHAVGAVQSAVNAVINQQCQRAFCAIRPPGHHAESDRAMGFCLFNNVAMAVAAALESGMERPAILDFDVHHGNGTVQIFQDQPDVLVCSSFQYPFYPGRYDQVDRPNICLCRLSAGSGSAEFRHRISETWIPAVMQHKPDMLFISAGFDAHREDPLGGLNLEDEDYYWVANLICQWADQFAQGRIVSVLEGGYNLDALGRSVVQHLKALTNLP